MPLSGSGRRVRRDASLSPNGDVTPPFLHEPRLRPTAPAKRKLARRCWPRIGERGEHPADALCELLPIVRVRENPNLPRQHSVKCSCLRASALAPWRVGRLSLFHWSRAPRIANDRCPAQRTPRLVRATLRTARYLTRVMPSRQEQRKAERDATKHAPRAGATGAAGAAAALANQNVIPLGDWTTQADDPYVGLAGYCLARRHVFIGCRSSPETRLQNANAYTWRAMSAWPDSSALLDALGVEVVEQRAAMGDGEAQFSQGCRLVSEGHGSAGVLGAGNRSPIWRM